MAIYAIADLHLSFDPGVDKPMNIYGERWEDHEKRIKDDWESKVCDDDTVIIAGDISWALKISEAMADLEWIHNLPGKKVLIKGNHELWWSSIGKLNRLYSDIYFLQNTFYEAEGFAICGSRGWISPGQEGFGDQDLKIYERELIRLEMSLSSAKEAGFDSKIIGALHYPPTNDKKQRSGFTELFEKYGAKKVVYGHLHGKDIWGRGIKGTYNGTEYFLVSQDYLNGKLIKLTD